MNFRTALNSWLVQHPAVSQRQLAILSTVPSPDVSKFRNGKRPITFDALCKLLPAVEQFSSRTHARALLVAYLHDETPPDYEQDVRIIPLADTTGQIDRDPITQARDRWEGKARTDAEFARMWLSLDGYMHDPESSSRLSEHDAAEIALLAEPVPDYQAKPTPSAGGGGGGYHDSIRTDAAPLRAAAQEHLEP